MDVKPHWFENNNGPKLSLKVFNFIQKLFSELGIKSDHRYLGSDSEWAEYYAINEVLSRVRVLQEAVEGPVSPEILRLLDLSMDMDEGTAEREAVKKIKELKERKRIIQEIEERKINALVNEALTSGPGVMQAKLAPHEESWAIEMGRTDGIEVLGAFIKARGKQLGSLPQIAKRFH